MNLKHKTEIKAYVNVAGGRKEAASLKRVIYEIEKMGLVGRARIAAGPLLRATSGSRLSHMPLSPDSTYTFLKKAMIKAYERANADANDPDPELDLGGAKVPKWSNHSWRRFADKVARDSMSETGVSEIDIDLFFGWLEKQYEKLMQLHYKGREDRVKRAAVTSRA